MNKGKKNVDNYESVDELIECQRNKINFISDALNLIYDQNHLESDVCKAITLIKNIDRNIKKAKKESEEAKRLFIDISELIDETKILEARIDHMENNLPVQFNKILTLDEEDSNKENVLSELHEDNSQPLLPTRRHLDFVEPSTPVVSKTNIIHKNIPYLTQTEFNRIPSYMRGRVSYDTVNNFIDKLNQYIADKYTLLQKGKSAAKKRSDIEKINIYKKQECPKTKGKRFITFEDLKTAMGGKVDKHTLNMIPMLRHTLRVQELRDDGIVRYIAITDGPH